MNMNEPLVILSTRVPPDVAEKIIEIAKEQERSVSQVINKIICGSFYSEKKDKPAAEKKSKSKIFQKPTLDEINIYMTEKGCAEYSEAEQFFDHYQSNGWRVGGKSQMKDWKAAIRKWLKNDFSGNSKKVKNDHVYRPTTMGQTYTVKADIQGECQVLK